MYNYREKFFYFFIFAGLLGFDQGVKYFIRIKKLFYICNQNIAFGLSIPPFLFWIIWTLIIVGILIAVIKKYLGADTIYLIIILSGAVANILDRIYYGCVLDFIDFHFWPIFNLADIFIVLGISVLLFKFLTKNSYAE